jgi:NADH:ubiquinone oxidoreductase subunit K
MGSLVKTVDMKVYRKIHLNFLTIMCLMAVASFILVQNGFYINWNFEGSTITVDILLIAMIGLAILFSLYSRRQKIKMQAIADFEEKLSFHRRYFWIRMWWLLLSGATSCFLFVLTSYRFFFWFVLFDFLSLLLAFPNKLLFKRELNEDEIIFL